MLRILAILLSITCYGGLSAATGQAQPPTMADADAFYEEGSYAKAAVLYEALQAHDSGEAADFLAYRLADSRWRSLASTNVSDPALLERERDVLRELADALAAASPGRPPQLWVLIQRSLGDSYWNGQLRDWPQAWAHYEQALGWWAGSTELAIARQQFLEILFYAWTLTPGDPQSAFLHGRGNAIPRSYLLDAVSIAEGPEARAQAHFMLALNDFRQSYTAFACEQAGKHFAAAVEEGAGTEWYAAALYYYGQWQEGMGASHFDDNGNWRVEGDPAAALPLYRRILETFDEGESSFWRQASRRVEDITRKELFVGVSHTFLPGSVVELQVRTRNVPPAQLTVYPLELGDVNFPGSEPVATPLNWWERVSLAGKEGVFRWQQQPEAQPYTQQSETVRIAEGLPAGLYLVEATAEGVSARSWLLVTKAALLAKTDRARLHVFAADAASGEPLEDAEVQAWFYNQRNTTRAWRSAGGQSNTDGLAQIALPAGKNGWNWMLLAETESGPALIERGWASDTQNKGQWRVYAFTDRPAYRPKEVVHWKFIARQRSAEGVYSIPPDTGIFWRIVDPQGNEVAAATADLNAYGSAWGELELATDWPLGLYRIEFRSGQPKGNWIGSETLFRLEEYKLPEFKVTVTAEGADGEAASSYRLGEQVAVAVQADYYFGGAVDGAEVEVVVRQKPFYHGWHPIEPYPWYRDPQRPHWGRHYGPGQEVQREQLTTDSQGRATFFIETPGDQQQDLEYTVEARVVDASRREIFGTASIKVTRQPYFAYVEPTRTLYRPGESASVTVKTHNADNAPVTAQGRIRVTREAWQEVWIGPQGEEISGSEYRRRQESRGFFSKRFNPEEWQLARQGYAVEEIKNERLQTNADGEAEVAFTLPQSGYYRIYWNSQDARGYPIKADAALWAADDATLDIGYRGGLKIVADADSFRAGGPTPVMLTTTVPGRTVWFTVESDGLLESRIVRMEGSARLLNLTVTEAWIPNVQLAAGMFAGLRFVEDQVEAIVPPVSQFLDVTITPSADAFEPREPGSFTIETRDSTGQPVSAELAFSLFDASVLYIQPELAPDPRAFFYGDKRRPQVQTVTSLRGRSFFQPKEAAETAAGGAFSGPFGSNISELNEAAVDPFAPEAKQMAVPVARSFAFADADGQGETGAPAGEPAVIVRSDFRATALWQPDVTTGPDGKATLELEFPDSLTTWQAQAWALGQESKFGTAKTEVATRLPLIARLQMPRFLVMGDRVTLSGVINNNTEEPIEAEVSLDQAGGVLAIQRAGGSLMVPPGGSGRFDFPAEAVQAGEAELTLTVRGGSYHDAVRLTLPVFEHGIDKFLAQSGKMMTDELEFTLDMPPFRAEGAHFEIYASPSLASTLLDALPYLAEYPYGCVEQTMSRFLPAVIVRKTLGDFGLEADAIMAKCFGGIEKAQGDVGSLDELDAMVAQGLKRLYDFQRGDGSWGWWKESPPDLYMSAYVVWGLTLAEQAGLSVDTGALQRGRSFLQKNLVEAGARRDLQAWMLFALAERFVGQADATPARDEARIFAELWTQRDDLNAYARALLTLAASHLGFSEEAQTLARNLANGAIIDLQPQSSPLAPGNPSNSAEMATAHWGADGIAYRWSQSKVEATAFAVLSLLQADAEPVLLEQAVNWLLQNRRGAQWSNTKDTAITILALSRYLQDSGQLAAEGSFAISLNGEVVAELEAGGPQSLGLSKFTVDTDLLQEGANTIGLRRLTGDAPLYFSARANFFTLENPIAAAGNVLFLQREFERIRPVETLLDGYRDEKAKIASGGTLESGDRVEVSLIIQAKNDLEYLVFEDLKAAGLEAVELSSGTPLYARELRVLPGADGRLQLPEAESEDRYTGRQIGLYQELRDRKIATFADRLPEGFWEVRYTLRAEVPGKFAALPALGHAMYVPEIRGNSDEETFQVMDKAE